MQLTTMTILEAEKIQLQKSKTLAPSEREDALLVNSLWRAILETLEVRSVEEAEDVLVELKRKADQVDALEREITAIKAEMETSRLEQETTK